MQRAAFVPIGFFLLLGLSCALLTSAGRQTTEEDRFDIASPGTESYRNEIHFKSAPYNVRNLNDAVFANPLGTKQCKVSGVLYNHSQKILFTDHCKACICIDGQIFCYWQCEETAHGTTGEEIEEESQSTSTANVISTTFDTEDSSKSAANVVPHSSPSDVFQTTTISPNETTEPFCLVMGVRYKPGSVLPRDTGSCLECQCGRNSQITCSPKDCITLNSLNDEDTSEPEFYGNSNSEQNNGNFNLDMFAVNVV